MIDEWFDLSIRLQQAVIIAGIPDHLRNTALPAGCEQREDLPEQTAAIGNTNV